MEISQSEICAIVGPSGSGKSTLLHVLGLLDKPDSGSFIFEGRQVEALSSDELATLRRQKIGFVFQSFHLLSHLTALENVMLPFIYQGIPRHKCRPLALEELRRVGLNNRVHHRPAELSGGQRQRVAIARALVTRPSIILADEPTGNLDSDSAEKIMKLFHLAKKTLGTAIIIVTHDLTLAAQCNSYFNMNKGTLSRKNFN
jgi:putative ABC transport system ATP-binding protein